MNRFTHFLFTSGFPRMACSVAPKSVHLNCGKGDRGSPRRRSFEHATQGTDVANCIGPFHAPASHKWLVTARSSLQLFFLVAAEAFTELECEGKEVPSLARESQTVHGNNLNDAGLQGEYTNGYK